jgi:hypothetical protein
MPPQEAEDADLSETEGKQTLFIIRHGDRYDYAHPEVGGSTRIGICGESCSLLIHGC